MPDTLPSIDVDTITFLAQAKKGKPCKFALIAKGSRLLRLIVFRKGGFKNRIQAAKKAGHRGIGYWGIVQGDETGLAFFLSTEDGFDKAPSVKDAVFKKFLLEHAQLTARPRFELVAELPALSETDEDAEESAGDSETPRTDAESGDVPTADAPDPAVFVARLKALKPGIEGAKERDDAIAQKIRKFVEAAATLGRNKEFDKGLRVLDEVEKLLDAPAPAAPPAGEGAAPAVAADVRIPPAGWEAESAKAVAELKECITYVAASAHADAGTAELQLRAVLKQLSGTMTTVRQAVEMRDYLQNDDVVADVAALRYDLKTPLLRLLRDVTTDPAV